MPRKRLGPVILSGNVQRRIRGAGERAAGEIYVVFDAENFLADEGSVALALHVPVPVPWEKANPTRDLMVTPIPDPDETRSLFPSRRLISMLAGKEIQRKLSAGEVEPGVTGDDLLNRLTELLQQRLRLMIATVGYNAAALGIERVPMLDESGFDRQIEDEVYRVMPISLSAPSTAEMVRALEEELREEVSLRGLEGPWGSLQVNGREVWMEVHLESPPTFSLAEMMAARPGRAAAAKPTP
jgi:hypothetical protein